MFKAGDKVRVIHSDKWGSLFKKGNIVTLRDINVSKKPNSKYISGHIKECIYLHTFRYSDGRLNAVPLKPPIRHNTKAKVLCK